MRRRSLYICYLSLDDPLVHTQVVAYLDGIAQAGHEIHLLTFEPQRLSRARRRLHRERLRQRGIRWHGLRYHKRPSLPATMLDVAAGAACATVLALRHRLDTVHARNHVPAAMALIAIRLLGPRAPSLVFDIRGLMAEEYVDAGLWQAGSISVRLTKRVERVAIRQAAGIVVLTERIRRQLFGDRPPPNTWVIPCCADVDRLVSRGGARERTRAGLGLDGSAVMVYVGKFGGWYMAEEMADFLKTARQTIPALHFLVLTQSDPAGVKAALDARGVTPHCTITQTPNQELGRYLSAADFGICFIRPTPSKASSSPTKVGEYLAAGLPVLATAGVGDLDGLITPDVGVLVERHDRSAYCEAALAMRRLLTTPEVRDRAHELAVRELSLSGVGVPRYRRLYEGLPACGR
jgi:glycosyltransferase involved in cell wall biosynthesis